MADSPAGPLLRAYLLVAQGIPLIAPLHLRRRLVRGKEDPERWREKLGRASLPRPEGPLVWLHAVGLGEVMALRGLIAQMADMAPAAQFLITSTARSAARVVAVNLPPRTRHQFLPLDAPGYLAQFLGHWRPSLSVWAEQELWPGAVVATHAWGIPLALVNARITADSHARRARARGLYRDLLARFALVTAQDPASADRLTDLGAPGVRVVPSLKRAGVPLAADEAELARLRAHLAGRRVWVAASTHPGDEREAMVAATALPDRLLILVPRDTARAGAIAAELQKRGLTFALRSRDELPGAATRVWIADSYGELGLWYRLAEAALVGGGFDRIGGHNPWEPALLGVPVLHGPDTANFAADYAVLDGAQAALSVPSGRLAAALEDPRLPDMALRATALVAEGQHHVMDLAAELLTLAGLR